MLKKLKDFLRTEIDPAFAKRAEIIFQYIKKYKPKRILDAGCGRGFYLYWINSYKFVKEIHGIDINEEPRAKPVASSPEFKLRLT
jgi:2-polyprenyl-3-methyl-5-hydroxy-6-metoxy-1,4-benzoquinol methylase